MPIFRKFGSKIVAKMQKRALDDCEMFCFFLHSLIIIHYIHVEQYKHVLDEYDHGNQQNPPFPKLHIELLKQFEGSRTFTNFIEPLLPRNRTEQPWYPPITLFFPPTLFYHRLF